MPVSPSNLDELPAAERQILEAHALLWRPANRPMLLACVRELFATNPAGKAFSETYVKETHQALLRRGLLSDVPSRLGYWQVKQPVLSQVYIDLRQRQDGGRLRRSVFGGVGLSATSSDFEWGCLALSSAAAIMRVVLLTDTPTKELKRVLSRLLNRDDEAGLLLSAFDSHWDAPLLPHLPAIWRDQLLYKSLAQLNVRWETEKLPVLDLALDLLQQPGYELAPYVRYAAAESLLHQGKLDQMHALLAEAQSPEANALRAACQVQAGKWSEAIAEFEAAIKVLKKSAGTKTVPLPPTLLQYYALALLAQQTPAALETARKFCLAESRSRSPEPWSNWGRWVHALDVRLGNTSLHPYAFRLDGYAHAVVVDQLWCCWLRAWLGLRPSKLKLANDENASLLTMPDEPSIIPALKQRLQDLGFHWLEQQLQIAENVFRGEDPPANCFIPAREESWRSVLTSLQALAGDTAMESGAEAHRIVWSLDLGSNGEVKEIQVLEQKRGVRGWGKPKALSLARLFGNEKLEPWDARVARAVREDHNYAKRYNLDRAAAIVALVGHPALVLAHQPEEFVELQEAAPEMEMVRAGKGFTLRITPPLRTLSSTALRYNSEIRAELEALSLITVVQESPRRLKLVRFTPAQKKIATLVAGRLELPAAAEGELQKTLNLLSTHFQIHSDSAQAAREVTAEARLRAELAPEGEGLVLRLVVAPLGEDGPRLMPGSGRESIMAAIKGESVGTRRDLKAETGHLNAVLDALPFLDAPAREQQAAEWRVEEPDLALTLLETLPSLPAVQVVDWPKGKAVRVIRLDSQKVGLRVQSDRDWFRLSGQVRVDEGLVLELEQLLIWSGSGRGRFLPMGEGVYVALTERLRAQLADVAAVAEMDQGKARIPQLAAVWLDQTLAGMDADLDLGQAFRERVQRLRDAQERIHAPPRSLQTELRPYQEDGYVWAMRLAEAGFGACLADDMGLGKTLQALALLLSRAGGGPALVVAPTSVCGNWMAEAARFAPSLNVHFYAEGDRAALVESVGPGDVLLVSYTLMQLGAELFATRTWHTLVVDEAQAVKNAQAKRTQALFDLAADFRLALSGTPVENRLAELWSILRFCNPGLLGSLARFNERFAGPIERDRDRNAQHLLRRLIAPFVLRRTKAQVLQELPPRTELTLSIVPDSAEAAHYEALRRMAQEEVENALNTANAGQARFHVLTQLTRLRRAACDPRLTSPELGISGAKVQAFADLAAELSANGHKTLVFSQFVDFLSLLREPLDRLGIPYQYLDGATPAGERTRRVNAFQNGEGDLFLISLKAGGFGLNLTAADYVVIADPWWNPAAEDQAMGRAHRIGQLRPVTVYRLVLKGSLEERIVKLHDEKRALAEGVLSDGEATALPSVEDLMGLIRG